MNRIILRKMVFEGVQKQPAVLNFDAGFNLITGPSDTGKSLIFECITYVLGGSTKPKQPPEATGYTNLFLTFSYADNYATIERSILSNDIKLYNAEYDRINAVEPDVMSGSAIAKTNVSDYLMRIFGIENKKLKKNERDEVVSLTFNILKNIILIDEEKIQSKISPILSGIPTSESSDKALFKFILTGVDYSNIIAQVKPEIRKADANARIDILKLLIGESNTHVDDRYRNESLSIEELEAQKSRLDISIENEISKISDSQNEIEDLQLIRKNVWDNFIQTETFIDQRTEIQSRFNLLANYYQTDLERLDASIETGEVLALSGGVSCPLCGAKSEFHRPDCVINEQEILKFKEACEIEKEKINSLKNDLENTIEQVNAEISSAHIAKAKYQADYTRLDSLINEKLEPSLKALKNNLHSYFDQKAKIEIAINSKTKINMMEKLMNSASQDLKPQKRKEKVPTGVQAAEVSELLKQIEQKLKDWHYPNLSTIGFSEILQDITIGDKNRGDQGKGYRAISCAAFIISLMDYCLNKEIPHPGFVVLDSPLVTFRGADKEVSDMEAISDETKQNFFISLSKMSKDRQVIIFENDEPPSEIIDKINYIHFTKDSALGRFGFIPIEGSN